MRLRKLYPFWIVFGIELSFILYLMVTHRGVIGHDAFAYFSLQYYVLNNAVQTGEPAFWIPLLAHGYIANWWYSVQAGILQNALLGFGELTAILQGWNFLPIYYLGILFDLTFLSLGTYLLAQRYFQSKLTILFVGITTVGSASWFTTVFANLHFYFALPLIFYLIHALLETGKWRYFLLAGNLFAIQSLGDAPYFLPFQLFVIVLYASLYVLFFWEKANYEVRRLLAVWPRALVPVVLVLVSMFLVYSCLTFGTEEITNYDAGRAPDGRNVSVESFLTYGTNSNFRWVEVVTRVSPALDYSLYFGYLALAFAGIAFFIRRSKAFLLVASMTAVLFLVSSSTPLASVLYYVWPGMKFFRHLSLVSTIVRMFLCFLAGFGFEAVLLAASEERSRQVYKVRMAILLLVAAATGLFKLSYDYYFARDLLWFTVLGNLPMDRGLFDLGYFPKLLLSSSLWCVGAIALLAVVVSRKVSNRKLAFAAILYQALDIYSFRADLLHLRTARLTSDQYEISRLKPVPYSARRSPADYPGHARGKDIPQRNYPYGEVFWSPDLLALSDFVANSGRTDSWMWSFDDFLRTYSGETLRKPGHTPAAYRPNQSFNFPYDNPNAQRIAGVTEDKIQFFSKAHSVGDDRKISAMMASTDFSGNLLILSGPGKESVPLHANERLERSYQVLHYDSNQITISVVGADEGDWLYYADCWHPFWSARVNGKSVPYYKANLAYKAVRLDQGDNTVSFRFNSPRVAFFLKVLSWNALVWVILPFYFLWRAQSNTSKPLDQGI